MVRVKPESDAPAQPTLEPLITDRLPESVIGVEIERLADLNCSPRLPPFDVMLDTEPILAALRAKLAVDAITTAPVNADVFPVTNDLPLPPLIVPEPTTDPTMLAKEQAELLSELRVIEFPLVVTVVPEAIVTLSMIVDPDSDKLRLMVGMLKIVEWSSVLVSIIEPLTVRAFPLKV